MKSSIFATALLASAMLAPAPQLRADEAHITLYSTWETELIEPLVEPFFKATGIKADFVYVADKLPERMASEGATSPADILMTIDYQNLIALSARGLTQKAVSPLLEKAVPAGLRDPDGEWFALSLRPRIIVTKAETAAATLTYEELADPKWRGKFCMRSALHKNNIALIAAFLLHHDEAATEAWLRGLKANLSRKPHGKDYDVIRDIASGPCEIGIANSNALAQLAAGKLGEEGIGWSRAAKASPSIFEGGGTNINITGAALAKNAPHKDAAIRFLEFLVTPDAQKLYAAADGEYPILPGVSPESGAAGLGSFTPDSLPLGEIDKKRKISEDIIRRVDFDN